MRLLLVTRSGRTGRDFQYGARVERVLAQRFPDLDQDALYTRMVSALPRV